MQRTTLLLVAALAAASTEAITIDSLTWDGDWRNGLLVAFSDADQLTTTEIAEPGIVVQGTGDAFPMTIGIVASDFGVANLIFSFFPDTGVISEQTALVPPGWEGTATLTYEPANLAGSLGWSFAFTPTPEAPWSPALLGLGALCLGAAVRRPQRQ